MTERWAPIPGHPGYRVSDMGEVQTSRSRWAVIEWRPLKGHVGRSGHIQVNLSRGRGEPRSTRLVHQLVMEAFVGPRPDGLEVCHNNGNGGDNRLKNLRYDTHRANAEDTARHGAHPLYDRPVCKRGHEMIGWNVGRNKSDGGKWCRTCKYDRAAERQRQRLLDQDHISKTEAGAA